MNRELKKYSVIAIAVSKWNTAIKSHDRYLQLSTFGNLFEEKI